MIKMDIIWIILTSLIAASRGQVENQAIFKIETDEFDSAQLQDDILSVMNETTIQLINSSLGLHDALGNVINISLAESVGILLNYINGTVKAGVEELEDAILDVRNELTAKLSQHDNKFYTLRAMLLDILCMVSREAVFYDGECITCEMFEGTCYIVIRETFTWDQASSKCKDLGGDLAVLLSQAEFDIIPTIFTSPMWIGLTDRAVAGQFQWVDGTVFDSAAFSSWWMIGEPTLVDRCVLMPTPFAMMDIYCNNTSWSLCEIKP